MPGTLEPKWVALLETKYPKRAYDKAELSFKGKTLSLKGEKNFMALINSLYEVV